MFIKELIKYIAIKFEIPLTQNLAYDIYTKRIMKQILVSGSNCIDIGCHKGEILDDILRFAPDGKHFAFEPLPHLYEFLKKKYSNKDITVYSVALFDKNG